MSRGVSSLIKSTSFAMSIMVVIATAVSASSSRCTVFICMLSSWVLFLLTESSSVRWRSVKTVV